MAACGLDVTGLDNPGRQLIIRNPGVEYIIVRPSDAPAFVELGAADCGICGEDSLVEAQPDVVELADLKFGACRFIVAEPAGAAEKTAEHYRRLGSIRIATKYPNITRAHYAKTGTQVEIVKLHGNIELAPLTGLAERIVDITATGTTLRENNLVIVEDVLASTARFFANGTSMRTDPAHRRAGRRHGAPAPPRASGRPRSLPAACNRRPSRKASKPRRRAAGPPKRKRWAAAVFGATIATRAFAHRTR